MSKKNAYVEMQNRHQAEVNALPMGFAFSQKQFDEMMQKWGLTPDDTDKIYSIGAGGFIRKTDRELIFGTFDRHRQELAEAIAADETGENFVLDMFRCELANHEYCITCDYEDTLNSLGLTYDDLEKQPKLLRAIRKAGNEIVKEWEESE